MAKKKTAGKKAVKRAKAAKPGRRKPVKSRQTANRAAPSKPAKSGTRTPAYGPTFFLTAISDTSPAYEIDGTPHPKTVRSYRLEQAHIMEYEEQDGKILYKVKPLKAPARS